MEKQKIDKLLKINGFDVKFTSFSILQLTDPETKSDIFAIIVKEKNKPFQFIWAEPIKQSCIFSDPENAQKVIKHFRKINKSYKNGNKGNK